MFSENKVFQATLLISIIAHAVILAQNPNFSLFNPKEKVQNKDIEVRYLKPLKEIKVPEQPAPRKSEPLLKLPPKITARDAALPPSLNKEDIFKRDKEIISRQDTFTKPAFIKPDIIAVRKKITLSPTNLDKISSPTYIVHSQIVREKIKRALYQNYNRMEVGEVYLSFILTQDGYLKEVYLIEEKSSPSPYLREIALKSIKDASPFPSFPKGLDYPQLSFNVIISFEIE